MVGRQTDIVITTAILPARLKNVNANKVSLSHLHGHFNQHEQLFYADPQILALHSFSYAGPLYVLKTAQQLWGGDKERRALSIGLK